MGSVESRGGLTPPFKLQFEFFTPSCPTKCKFILMQERVMKAETYQGVTEAILGSGFAISPNRPKDVEMPWLYDNVSATVECHNRSLPGRPFCARLVADKLVRMPLPPKPPEPRHTRNRDAYYPDSIRRKDKP